MLGEIGILKTLGAQTSKDIALGFDAETQLTIDQPGKETIHGNG
ncbi:MAG: hypothetical protein ACJAVT_000100 [Yoonia sp.]|jgi:hypothetical protein